MTYFNYANMSESSIKTLLKNVEEKEINAKASLLKIKDIDDELATNRAIDYYQRLKAEINEYLNGEHNNETEV